MSGFYSEEWIMMNAVLLIGWVVVIVASYKGAIAVLEKSDNL